MRIKIISILLLFFIGLVIFVIYRNIFYKSAPQAEAPKEVSILGKTKVKYPEDFTIVMIGDSMTEALGNSDEIKQYLSEYYPDKTFEVLNYGFGATNILSVMDRITKETEHGRIFRPIKEIDYNLVLLESFGQNPLSNYPLEEGLKKQTEELKKIVKELKTSNLEAEVIFVASISPNKDIFAKNQVDLTPEVRREWVNERIAYIKNHIKFAQDNNIPLINVFEKSLLDNGDGNPEYITRDDYIHPSPTGIRFISKVIANFIYEERIF